MANNNQNYKKNYKQKKSFGVIKYILVIVIILAAAFLSQQFMARKNSVVLNFPPLEKAIEKGRIYSEKLVAKTGSWTGNNINPFKGAVGEYASAGIGALQSFRQSAEEGIEEQKDAVLQSSAGTAKKFIAEKFLQMLGVAPEQLMREQPQCQNQN